MKASAKFVPCDCGGRALSQFAAATFNVGGIRETVEKIPAFVCEKCGEVYYDGPSIVKTERKLERKVALT